MLQEEVAFGDEQGAVGDAAFVHGRGHIIQRQVIPFVVGEAGGDDGRSFWQVPRQVGAAVGRDGHAARIVERAVQFQAEEGFAVLRALVGDAGEELGAAFGGAGSQGGDGEVFGAAADGQVEGGGGQGGQIGGQAAIGNDDDTAVCEALRRAGGQGEGGGPVGGAVFGLGGVQGAAQGGFVAAGAGEDGGGVPDLDEGHLAAAAQVANQLGRFGFGGGEAGGGRVGGLHGGGAIEQDDGAAGDDGGDGQKRPCEGQDQGGEDEKL